MSYSSAPVNLLYGVPVRSPHMQEDVYLGSSFGWGAWLSRRIVSGQEVLSLCLGRDNFAKRLIEKRSLC